MNPYENIDWMLNDFTSTIRPTLTKGTVRGKLESMLIQYGMFESQAKEVIDLSIPKLNELVDEYKISFDRPQTEYPDTLYSILFLNIKPIALKWIDDNKPMAWYRDMFI